MTEGEAPKIEIASGHESIDELRKKAQEPLKVDTTPRTEREEPKEKQEEKSGRTVGETVVDILSPAIAAGGTALLEEVGEGIAERIKRGGAEAEPIKTGEQDETPEQEPNREKDRDDTRSFNEISGEIAHLINNPDPAREREIRMERARLVRDATDIGVFTTLKGQMSQIQGTYDFNEAGRRISQIDVDKLEDEADGLVGWDDKYKGMIEEYRNVALLNMELAFMRAGGRGDESRAKQLERAIDLRGWGLPPAGLEHMALEYIESQSKKNPVNQPSVGMDEQKLAALFGAEFARVFENANVPPSEQRKAFLEVEEWGIGEVQVPLTTSVFLKDLSKEEKDFWRARIALSNARSFRQKATSPDTLFPNEFIQGMSNGDFEALYNIDGVMEAQTLYTIMAIYSDCTQLGGGFGDLFSGFEVQRSIKNPDSGRDEIVRTNIKSILDIRNNDELKQFRENFRLYMQRRFGLTEEQALDAELVGFNLYLMSDINELSNSAYFARKQDGSPSRKRIKTAEVYSLLINTAQRDLIHPLEKALDDNRDRSKPRAWPLNVLGEYVRFHLNFPAKRFPIPPFLSRKGASYLLDHEIVSPGGRKITLYEQMRQDGLDLVNGVIDEARKIDWKSTQGENPYLGYYLNKNKQILVWSILDSGYLPKDKPIEKLINAFIDLDISDNLREAIAYMLDEKARSNIDPRRDVFEPRWGLMDFGISKAAFFDRFVRDHPGFFKSRHKQKSILGTFLDLGS